MLDISAEYGICASADLVTEAQPGSGSEAGGSVLEVVDQHEEHTHAASHCHPQPAAPHTAAHSHHNVVNLQ